MTHGTTAAAIEPPMPTPAGPDGTGHHRPHRRGAKRRMVTSILVVAALAAGIGFLAHDGAPSTSIPQVEGRAPTAPPALARYDATAFLIRYLAPDGRVIRRDQGGDTVSEGQAYAMLLAAAVGNQDDFNAAWRWDVANLQLPDHLSSYHWQDGTVVGADPATDADLDMAWALVMGAKRFDDPAYRSAGLQMASAILANETVTAGGRLELVAGPWARSVPYAVDPSYMSPEAMNALASATGDPRWTELENDSVALLDSVDSRSPPQLPPDWMGMQVGGQARPASPPSTTTAPAYGLDAQRVPVWFAAACSGSGRAVAASTWPILQSAPRDGGELAYSLTGAGKSTLTNPLGYVAAAAAADASGDHNAAARLLNLADEQANRYHTYYGDAWIALGRLLLDTRLLSPCPPSPAS